MILPRACCLKYRHGDMEFSTCSTVKGTFLLFFSLGRRGELIKLWPSFDLRSGMDKFQSTNLLSLDGQNRQSPIASVQRTQSTLASHTAVPRGTNAISKS